MKTNTMEASNNLIAEFMGYPTSAKYWKGTSMANWKHEDYKDYYYVDGKHNHMDGSNFHLSDMKFDLSWDWLMPVVQKCRQENRLEYFDRVYYALEECDINVTYKAVVQFIKNQHN